MELNCQKIRISIQRPREKWKTVSIKVKNLLKFLDIQTISIVLLFPINLHQKRNKNYLFSMIKLATNGHIFQNNSKAGNYFF